ncbi:MULTISPECIES: hypothetical protein [unclassified Neisseria]|uniref:hypothetical protein n=1 Tax=unclassified Neisseria TaxID=2623750 RepID=UPI00266631AB|nr:MULTISPECIES: hypothetical protein [unclassified Neisseria]MDO1510226.1 hypothetical protein [Neisseria sp. MVDL19-042950]MDO1516395.1 hypothetical protein [Neisseria sp. MVDL18-041461]MDO1563543.1 hypothetical protein [Neisseria sp. MVDL20-010259]
MQQQSVPTVLQSFEKRQDEAREVFLHQLVIYEQNITATAELLQKTDLQQAEIEEKLFGSISQRMNKDTEQRNHAFLGRLKGYLIAAYVAWAVTGLLMAAAVKL